MIDAFGEVYMSFFSKSLFIKLVASLIILSTTSYAAQANPILQEKKEVLKQASNFAQAVACYTTFTGDAQTTIEDVYLVESSDGYAEYFVFWSGDWSCWGGASTYRSYLTSFSKLADNRPFIVDKQDILADINADGYLINDRFIKDVKYEKGKFFITGSDFSNIESDFEGNNLPINRYQYTLAKVDSNDETKWALLDKKFIGKNKRDN